MADRPACDQCRRRKIRCSRDWPCTACQVANQFCTTTGQGLELSDSMPRGHASSQFEHKIDTIAGHVDSVAGFIGGLLSAARNFGWGSDLCRG
ncbi:uncharacterized protein LMH87_008356 [Akanthomyces muscarius]|uniref:Zn(2)-C6 fungal-type domain-containing protein n=1 Tax=Akanthomyces muscarius TaxID=2231603 RepID=A0A9W8QJJ0_AKAMU|nr:uncharacterized protein LMH87_008356 [Akanthomyces muscarius]KAJ4159456.1 hypothetical protein LMH87_008356 [Akanthomyces muscarius]